MVPEVGKSRLLFLWPPELPYDLTIHYHYTLFGETAAYFADKPNFQVDIFDGGVLAHLKKEYIQQILKGYDYMAVYTQVQNTHSAISAAQMCKEITPETKVIGYGPSCLYVPHFFKEEPFNGYVWGGDPELAIESFIDYDKGRIGRDDLAGFAFVDKDGSGVKGKPQYLSPEQWSFPPLDKLPLQAYDRIVSKKAIKRFGDRQISVTAARGCPYDCDFCFASLMFGRTERRRPIGQLIDFVNQNRDKFNSLQMFSPNFTLNRNWVMEFCEEMTKKDPKLKWRCTTRMELLDQQMVESMAKAGCESVGIGVETLSPTIQGAIHKKQEEGQVVNAIKMLKGAGINAKGYIMVGLPGQTREDIYHTIRVIQAAGGEVRPSSYSPYQNLNEKSTLADIAAMNRYTHELNSVPGLSPLEYMNIIFNRDFQEYAD